MFRRPISPPPSEITVETQYRWGVVAPEVEQNYGYDPPAEASEIILEICWLKCVLVSPLAAPTYLKQCQVPIELRKDYYEHLVEFGGPRNEEEYWNLDDEVKMHRARCELNPMTETQIRQQHEITRCVDTNDWMQRTENGKIALPEDKSNSPIILKLKKPRKPKNNNAAVTAIFGAKRERGLIHFLVTLEGQDDDDANWVPADQVRDELLVNSFYEAHGKLTRGANIVLSPEGRAIIDRRNEDASSTTSVRADDEDQPDYDGQSASSDTTSTRYALA